MDSAGTSKFKTAIPRLSESVFVGLCHILGTSQLVAMRRDMGDIRDMVENQVRASDGISLMVSGSKREGFRLGGSDIDVMTWPNDHRVIWISSQSKYYNIRRQKMIICDCSDSPPGFTLLYLLSVSINRDIQRACVIMNNRFYISSSKYKQIVCSSSSLNSSEHGPCASGKVGTTEYDFAYCFVCDLWPPSASSWIDRCHSWPQRHIVDDILKSGCHFVAIGHKQGSWKDYEWRISFSLAEQKLVFAMNHCQFLTYGLLKLFLTEIINTDLSDIDKLLCSYHMKTAVFWVIQQNTIPHWCPQNLLECFLVCFKLILKWVYEGACPNFFIPYNNMFLGKVHGGKQHQLFIRLYGLYEKGLEFLLQSPSIKSYIIYVFHTPRQFICTDEHILLSEVEFDANLFSEMQNLEVANKENMQSCMRCLHTIEQMIGLPLLTRYQVLLLQQGTVKILQKIAFISHMETYTHKNKQRYKSDKISCYMLKLAAKFGFISDKLYIAMYYYKTLRYKEASSIIAWIKVSLAKPYVMHMHYVDRQRYTEAVGEQSWTRKMRQAAAWNIRLSNEIHYIDELIAEQQFALESNRLTLLISPSKLLHMMENLCSRYRGTMRIQTALDDLQTLDTMIRDGLYIHNTKTYHGRFW
ncbi:uncharacterized protein LOC134241421 [Saccostrea cucullata]|uniref:uncharacterized protein LOC134241421 n=1 Tax=Saccostrea cuccullata TaxID=36930 RepID=UPI002ED0F7AD